MIPGLKEKTEITDFGNGCVFIVHYPDTPSTVEEAEAVCVHLRNLGYYCGIIYQYTHFRNGKRYIGQTMHPLKRHLCHLRNSRKDNPDSIFGKMLKKYGVQSFDYDVLDVVYDKDEGQLHKLLNESEIKQIAFRGTSTKEHGYNVAPGGWGKPSAISSEKPVDMYDLQGNYIRSFRSISQASAMFGFTGPSIRQVCNHVHESAGGYLWAWTGQKPVLPTSHKVYAYDDNGKFVAEYDNAFAASKIVGKHSNAPIASAIKDKYRMAYGMYWRDYKTDQIPLTDFPKAVFAYDLDGNFVRGFINLAKAKLFTHDTASSSISHAIIRKTAHKGYLWRKEYAPHIDPSDGRFINKAAVIAILPDGTKKYYEMIKDAAKDNNIHPSGVQRSLKLGTKTLSGIQFIRTDEQIKKAQLND